jgi:hypothetical protein
MSINQKSHAFDASRSPSSTSKTESGLPVLVITAVALAVVLWMFSWVDSPALWQDPDIIPYL